VQSVPIWGAMDPFSYSFTLPYTPYTWTTSVTVVCTHRAGDISTTITVSLLDHDSNVIRSTSISTNAGTIPVSLTLVAALPPGTYSVSLQRSGGGTVDAGAQVSGTAVAVTA
jgi:hypothetical protein